MCNPLEKRIARLKDKDTLWSWGLGWPMLAVYTVRQVIIKPMHTKALFRVEYQDKSLRLKDGGPRDRNLREVCLVMYLCNFRGLSGGLFMNT